jgi:SAM-dependent methyltransferase
MAGAVSADGGESRAGIYYRSCNFCGGTKFSIFKQIDLSFPTQIYGDAPLTYPDIGGRLKLQYLECGRCRLIGINPLTVFADIDRHTFDSERNIVAWADLDYEAYEADKLWTTGILYEQYDFERYRRTNRVLDVSCGPGVSLSWLRDEKRWQPHGVDPDLHSVRTARQRYGLEIANGLIEDVPAPDEYFDIVVFDNSLEHTFDPLGALLTTFRLLRRGGMLLIAVPNANGLYTRVDDANAYWGHWFFYRAQVLAWMLRRIGFDVTRVVADQGEVQPKVVAALPDLGPYEAGLRVALTSEEEVRTRLPRTALYADYFNLSATKPDGADVRPSREHKLRWLAAASRLERDTVEIGEPSPAARAWRVLRQEGPRSLLVKTARYVR